MRLVPAFLLTCVVSGASALFAADAHLYVQLGHSAPVGAIAFTPDGRFMATGSGDQTALLWDTATGMELRRITGHSNGVSSVAFSPDGRTLLTGSIDSTARLWDPTTGKELKRFAHPKMVHSAIFSPDGRFVLTGCGDHIARLWSVATGTEVMRFVGHTQSIYAVAFSPDGRFVLTGSGKIDMPADMAMDDQTGDPDFTVRLWNAATGSEIRRFVGHTEAIEAVAFSQNGRYVITGSYDKTARTWDAQTGRELRRFIGTSRNDFISSVQFSRDGRFVLTGHIDGPRLWDAATGNQLRHFSQSGVEVAAFSPDGHSVFAATANDALVQWTTENGEQVRRYTSHAAAVGAASISPDGRLLVTSQFRMAQLWDLQTGAELRRIKPQTIVLLGSVAFSPDGRQLIMGGGGTATANLDNDMPSRFFSGGGMGTAAVFSPDGRYVATAGDGAAALWDTATRAKIRSFGPPGKSGNGVSSTVLFSPDGRFLLTADASNPAILWDVASGAEVRRFESTPGGGQKIKTPEGGQYISDGIDAIAFSPDGRFVLTGGVDKNARLWDAASGSEIRRLVGHSGAVASVAFSPDGTFVLTGSMDGTARLWDAATGKELRNYTGHASEIHTVAFLNGGQFVLSASEDATTRIWDPATGKQLASLVSFDRGWAVIGADGRFDTSDLDGGAPLAWIIDSDPMRALPLEIFMRDYYTPRLLPRILNGESLPPLRSIGEIKDRVQPDVKITAISVSPADQARVDVVVHAASRKDESGTESGLQDLRLFRNGQLVANTPLDHPLADGDFTFRNIRMPMSAQGVRFTAYAFNKERIKSPTAQKDISYEALSPVKPHGYLLQIGVNHYHAQGCDLNGSVTDANELSKVLSDRLAGRGLDVRAVRLISTTAENSATKEKIREALKQIAAAATPDDVLFLSFSGHGYSDKNGQFYILPSDVEGSCAAVDDAMLRSAISADELAEWLRPIDAGEMTFVLDSCQSASSVEANDFKPGPMGSHGLGQLAYDKRIRILAASQSNQAAHESDSLHQGLLSYALTEEGLVENKADWRPIDHKITIGEWLGYAANEVPKFRVTGEVRTVRGLIPIGAPSSNLKSDQIPAVFDFSSQDTFVLQEK
ncbi:MAG TPA: caspase family protein [Terracidiphilus sp.]|nr:caspase family protein [Terracidiphilus sp.]